jgi:hypothetical protein
MTKARDSGPFHDSALSTLPVTLSALLPEPGISSSAALRRNAGVRQTHGLKQSQPVCFRKSKILKPTALAGP